MIPLVNPAKHTPSLWKVDEYFQRSLLDGHLSNFGTCWHEAAKRIRNLTGRHAVPVSSGTAALQIAIQLARGNDELGFISIPEFTFKATHIAAKNIGFVETLKCSQYTWLPDPDCILPASYRVVVIVSPFGYRCDFEFWDDWSVRNDVRIVYDLAGAWGMKINTKNPCAMSFHATKNLPIGEGGVVLCEEKQWEKARRLSNFDFDDMRQPHSDNGFNGKMDELHAAMLLTQLDRNDKALTRIETKRALTDAYLNALPDILLFHDRHHGNAAPSLCAARVAGGGHDAHMIVEIGKKVGFVARRGYWPPIDHGDSLTDVICLPSDIVPLSEEFDLVCNEIRKGLSHG